MTAPYHGRGAQRQIIISADEPALALDPLAIVHDWLETGHLPNIVLRIPDSDGLIINTTNLFAVAQIKDGLAILAHFGEPLVKSFWFIEPLERCRHIAFAEYGWDFHNEVRRWK